jgi:anti-sigma factor RsiW
VTNRYSDEHLGDDTLQAFLEGDLSGRERGRAEEHLASCPRCSAELDGWRLLFEEIQDLPVLAPQPGFGDRVLAGVRSPEPLPWAARVAARFGVGVRDRHPSAEGLQDLVDGALPDRQAERLRRHLEGCATCAHEAASWILLGTQLGRLPRMAPADGFVERVMAQVRVSAPVPAAARIREWRRALGWARRLVPQTRQAWAAVSGVALTPVVTLGVVLWTVFAHPALTPGALVSFAWWKASALAGSAWSAVSAAALQSESLFGVYSFLGSIVRSPAALATAFLVFSLGTLAASWVLYRNFVPTRRVEGRYAHASLS